MSLKRNENHSCKREFDFIYYPCGFNKPHWNSWASRPVFMYANDANLVPKDEVLRVIRNCVKEDILADILGKEASRIMNSVLENFNMDVFVEAVMADGEAKGIKIGEERGEAKGMNKLAEVYGMLKSGMSPNDILAKGYGKEYIDLAKSMMGVD